jgi:NAD(P)-dependent dehydrogenase (short-subunit alcohol dehydrogenase family)
MTAYSTCKMAIARLWTSLMLEHPEVSFFSVHPSTIETDLVKNAMKQLESVGIELDFDSINLPTSFIV